MMRRTANVQDFKHPQIVLKCVREIARSVVADQPRAILDRNALHPCPLHRPLDDFADRRRRHVRFQLPRQNEPRVIVEHRDQVIPTPAHHEKVARITLPLIVWPCGLDAILLAGRKSFYFHFPNQSVPLQYPIHGRFRDREVLVIADPAGDLSWTVIRLS
jgi:hypothetical protein